MLQLLLIEHDDVRGLWPFSATHASWELRCGHFTMLERWRAVLPDVPVDVSTPRTSIEAAFRERHGNAVTPLEHRPTLVMSAHVLLSPHVIRSIVASCTSDPLVIRCHGESVGIFLPQPLDEIGGIQDAIQAVDPERVTTIDVDGVPLTRLWQVFDHIATAITWDASLMDGHIHPSAMVHATSVIDTSRGPVIIDADAEIGPLAVLIGPCAIGRGTKVKPHSIIHGAVIGPVCKVAGEIEDTVMQGYGNKQHDGFLGHSYLCEWTNLGAGTITSDLMNTYGSIIVSTPWGRTETARTFLGLLMGDHAKTAIGTCFMTGTLVGVCANIVGTDHPARLLPSFTWKDTATPRYNIEKAIAVARTVMGRRHVELGPATERLLRSIHEDGDV